MRVVIKFQFPADYGNELIRSGKLNELFENLMGDLKPEAAYFYPENGMRGGHVVVNMEDSSQVASFGERFWLAFGADVEMTPVMAQEDLMKALESMDQVVDRFDSGYGA